VCTFKRGSSAPSHPPTHQDTKPTAAAAVLEQSVPAAVPGAELARSLTLADGAEYRAWTVASLFGDDVMEFVLRPNSPPSRGAGGEEGAGGSGVLVTYRSQAGSLKVGGGGVGGL